MPRFVMIISTKKKKKKKKFEQDDERESGLKLFKNEVLIIPQNIKKPN